MTNFSIEKATSWIKKSVTLKLIVITILMLLLLIPQGMIKSIIYERESLSENAISEVSSKWANSQVINGPILSMPLVYNSIGKNKGEIETITKYLHILPEELKISGDITPTTLYRGIYKIVVFKSNLNIQGNINTKDKIDQTNLVEVRLQDAFITLGISDLRGIEDELTFQWGDKRLSVESGSKIGIGSAVTIPLPALDLDTGGNIPFDMDIKLQGSRSLRFVPTGSNTQVNISSEWADPSFNGIFLPDQREVTDAGFSASWKVLKLNRNFPNHWTSDTYFNAMQQSSFGVDLKSNVGNYGRAMRSAKYGAMIIALTFLIFFLSEVLYGNMVHPFQYVLIGLALCLFFILLIALSEHISYNSAYITGAISTISMISLYSLSVFRHKKTTAILAGVLMVIYVFMYVTLQSTDYALLIGSVGLAAILGATMYFTRNIDWYGSKD